MVEALPPARRSRAPAWRRALPWLVSALALGYVFGWVVDWRSLPAASEGADLPLFIAICIFDKIVFFLFWGWIQARVIQRLVEPISTRQLIQVKGASEILRVVSNPLGDAGFFFGVAQLVRGRLAAIAAVAIIPFACHSMVLLLQVTLSLLLLEGGVARNRDVAVAVSVGWAGLTGLAILARVLSRRSAGRDWLAWLRPRTLAPFLPWFLLLAAADVTIQGLATRAFGVPIPWVSLAGRIPILYAALSIPSLGNFGTRELAWAQLFNDYASRETLVAYSLWTNVIFLAMNAAIGALFLPQALALVREMRRARREGEALPQPLLHDPADP